MKALTLVILLVLACSVSALDRGIAPVMVIRNPVVEPSDSFVEADIRNIEVVADVVVDNSSLKLKPTLKSSETTIISKPVKSAVKTVPIESEDVSDSAKDISDEMPGSMGDTYEAMSGLIEQAQEEKKDSFEEVKVAAELKHNASVSAVEAKKEEIEEKKDGSFISNMLSFTVRLFSREGSFDKENAVLHEEEHTTFWSRIKTFMSGSNKGFHALPEVNDEEEMQNLKLQNAMDKKSSTIQTTSNILNKTAETEKEVIGKMG